MLNVAPWIQTLDNKVFDLENPKPETISLDVIAVVLSRIPRFGGHTTQFYSVAEHSVRVALLAMATIGKRDGFLEGRNLDSARWALLHDAHEAYSGFGDVCSPAKQLLPGLKEIEQRLDYAILERFNLPQYPDLVRLVRHCDLTLLATEARDVMGPPPQPWIDLPEPLPEQIMPWKSRRAELAFKHLARQLELRPAWIPDEEDGDAI